MGVGHVPTGSFRQERQSDDVPRREHRGTRTDLGSLEPAGYRHRLGAIGEILAARFLIDRGASIVGRNVRVGRGEIDLIARFGSERVVVEVKTATGEFDPVFHFDGAKEAQVRSLAAQCGISRVDYIGVVMRPKGVLIRWLPATA